MSDSRVGGTTLPAKPKSLKRTWGLILLALVVIIGGAGAFMVQASHRAGVASKPVEQACEQRHGDAFKAAANCEYGAAAAANQPAEGARFEQGARKPSR